MTIKNIYKGLPFKPEYGCLGIANAYLISIEKYNMLYDTGPYGARKEIKKLLDNNKIDCVIISHLHFDHCSNLDLFIKSQTPIYISKVELEEYERNLESDLDLYRPVKSRLNNLNIVKKEELNLPNCIKIISTPGHTLGHISLEIDNEKEKILLAGDSIKTFKNYQNALEFGNAVDKELCIKTKRELKEKYNHICLGHDGEIVDGKLINRGGLNEF